MTTGPIFIVQHHYTDDDDDDDLPHRFYPSPVVHAGRSSWLIWLVIVLFVSVGGSGAGFMRWKRGSRGNQILSGAVWSGSEPLVCNGNDEIVVSGVNATFSAGAAIQASGNCHVRCTDCDITAPTAIEAGGNAEVVITNGSVKGTTLLANASGNAHVTIAGNVTASGTSKHSGNATISAPSSTSPPPNAASSSAPPHAPAPAAVPSKKPPAKKR